MIEVDAFSSVYEVADNWLAVATTVGLLFLIGFILFIKRSPIYFSLIALPFACVTLIAMLSSILFYNFAFYQPAKDKAYDAYFAKVQKDFAEKGMTLDGRLPKDDGRYRDATISSDGKEYDCDVVDPKDSDKLEFHCQSAESTDVNDILESK